MLFLLFAWHPLNVPAQETVLKVIQLSSRTADEVVDLILPFLAPEGTAVASGTKLIIRTSPENLAEVEQLIDQLDQRPAQFEISVLQTSQRTLQELNAGSAIDGAVSSRGAQVRARGHLYQTDSKTDGETTQKLRIMEGRAAHIEVGRAYPVILYSGQGYGSGPYYSEGTGYQEATTGFAVIPRMAGDEVLLEVSPWSDRFSRLGGGVVNTQSAHTTIRAPLGTWVNFGGQDDSDKGYGRATLGIHERTRKRAMNIYIRVDRIP